MYLLYSIYIKRNFSKFTQLKKYPLSFLRYTHCFNILTSTGEKMQLKQLGFLLLTTSILTFAGNTNVYDMDIGNIKLDMSPEDVNKNLQSKYNVTK